MRWQGRVEPVKVSYDVQSGGSWGLCRTCFLIIGLLSESVPVPGKWRWNEIKFRNCENKKKMFFFFPISSMQTDKKTEIAQAEMTQCTRAVKETFFSLIQEQRHTLMHLQRQTSEFLKTFPSHKISQHLFSINTIHINSGGNWLV